MKCEICEKIAIADGLCADHLKDQKSGTIEVCEFCHKHWAKVGYACANCWDEELKVLGEKNDN